MHFSTLTMFLVALGAVDEMIPQRLFPVPSQQEVFAGEVATITYAFESTSSMVAGLGVYMYYDSSRVTRESSQALVSFEFNGSQDGPDDWNDDNDPATDRRVIYSWYSLGALWPGEGVSYPLDLVRFRFRTHAGYGSTRINLIGSACGYCVLEVEPAAIINVIAAPAPTSVAPPEIPSLSDLGLLVLIAALACAALLVLMRQRP